ncbi:MAG: DUF362 domain-containing protein [archaeon]
MHKKVVVRTVKTVGRKPLNDIFNSLDVFDSFKGKKVFIKPNLVCSETSDTGATIDPKLISLLIKSFVEKGYKVTVGEAGANHFISEETFDQLNIYSLCEENGAKFVNLNTCPMQKMKLVDGFRPVKFPKPVLDADHIVNLPKLKTHNATRVSFSIKNLYGLLPGDEKWEGHRFGLNKFLIALATKVPVDLIIVDALTSMHGLGPTLGLSLKTNMLIGSNDMISCDHFCSKLMKVNPMTVGHLRPLMKELPQYETDGEYKEYDFKVPGKQTVAPMYLAQKIFFGHAKYMKPIGIDIKALMRTFMTQDRISFIKRVQKKMYKL